MAGGSVIGRYASLAVLSSLAFALATVARLDRDWRWATEELHALRDEGKLPKPAADRLDATIRRARGGEWLPAAKDLYAFIGRQRAPVLPLDVARRPIAASLLALTVIACSVTAAYGASEAGVSRHAGAAGSSGVAAADPQHRRGGRALRDRGDDRRGPGSDA